MKTSSCLVDRGDLSIMNTSSYATVLATLDQKPTTEGVPLGSLSDCTDKVTSFSGSSSGNFASLKAY